MFRRQTQLIRIKLHAAFRLIRLNQRFIEALKYIFFTTFTFDNGRSIRSITVENIAKLKEENEVLSEIRDTLLPKLMSGELPVEVGEN